MMLEGAAPAYPLDGAGSDPFHNVALGPEKTISSGEIT